METKHIYIDESGNPKNTNIFIICLIIFKNKDHRDLTNIDINNFKSKNFSKFNINNELHFNKESFATKIKFFKFLNLKNFIVRYFEIKKDADYYSVDEYIIQSIIENKEIANKSIIYIDGSLSKKYNRLIISKIKHKLKERFIYPKYIQYVDSKNNDLIQLADMCAGFIRRKIERNTVDDQKLYNIIKHNITNPK